VAAREPDVETCSFEYAEELLAACATPFTLHRLSPCPLRANERTPRGRPGRGPLGVRVRAALYVTAPTAWPCLQGEGATTGVAGATGGVAERREFVSCGGKPGRGSRVPPDSRAGLA
jgi:hypothetical protein